MPLCKLVLEVPVVLQISSRVYRALSRDVLKAQFFFSLLMNELPNEITTRGKHGIFLGPVELELFLLLFVDDLTTCIKCSWVTAKRLCLTVNLEESIVIVFRKGGLLAAREKWVFGESQLEIVNSYKYLGLSFSTRHRFAAAVEDTAVRAKKSKIEI